MAILDDAEITKPIFPGIPPATPGGEKLPYDYLATVGLTENVLKCCCIKEVEITGLSSRESVIVDLEGDEYEDVPVWVHTDIGTRLAMAKEEPLEDPSLYFKDSALMFPLVECKALAIVYTSPETAIKEVVAVIHVVDAPVGAFPDEVTQAFPTYRMYAKFMIYNTADSSQGLFYLYDMLEDQIANIPTHPTSGSAPETPFFNAYQIPFADEAKIDNFLQGSISIGKRATLGLESQVGDVVLSSSASCRTEGGVDTDPAWTQTGTTVVWPGTPGTTQADTWEAECCGGTYSDVLYRTTNTAGDLSTPPSPVGSLLYERDWVEDMPIIKVTDNSMVTSTSCFGVAFYSGADEISKKITLADGDGQITEYIQGHSTKHEEDVTSNVNGYEFNYDHFTEIQNSFSVAWTASFTGETTQTFTDSIITSNVYEQLGVPDVGSIDSLRDTYEAIRLGENFRLEENLFCDSLSMSFFMFAKHSVYTIDYPPALSATEVLVETKEAIGPSKDFIRSRSLVNTLNMTPYAYSELEAYILAGDYDPADFVSSDPCGLTFLGFYFKPYDIRADLLTP